MMLHFTNQNNVTYEFEIAPPKVKVTRVNGHGVEETWTPCGPGDVETLLGHYAIGSPTTRPRCTSEVSALLFP
jgi:hypothetical protein